MNLRILHITPHLGGGIGSAVLNWTNKDINNEHTILCLDETYTKDSPEYQLANNHIYENTHDNPFDIFNRINYSDIVILHFWNHPRMFELLTNFQFPECRLILWCHISGLYPPYTIPKAVVEFVDTFVFTSPISYEIPEIKNLPSYLKNKLNLVWTVGDITKFRNIKKIQHITFNIGYLGTLDFAKLHPNFIELCSKINIPNVRFIIIGRGNDSDKIIQQIKEKNLEWKFTVTGYVNNLNEWISYIDIFGYPLNPKHFGTCEQVLGEMVAAGIIPVVLNNPAENFIFSKSSNLITATTEEEYIAKIEELYNNIENYDIKIKLLQEEILDLYNPEHTTNTWTILLNNSMLQPKQDRNWENNTNKIKYFGHEIFIKSLGNHAQAFIEDSEEKIKEIFNSNPQWKSKTKGSVLQYLKAFPNDMILKKWSMYV